MRFATAACMQKYGNVSFATVACAKCMRYGGRGGGTHTMGGGGGVATRDTEPYIYITYILWPKVQIINVGNSIGRLFVKDLIEAHGGHRTVSFQSIRQEAKIARQKAWKTKNNMYTDNGYSSEDVWILLEMGIFQCPINFQGS